MGRIRPELALEPSDLLEVLISLKEIISKHKILKNTSRKYHKIALKFGKNDKVSTA